MHVVNAKECLLFRILMFATCRSLFFFLLSNKPIYPNKWSQNNEVKSLVPQTLFCDQEATEQLYSILVFVYARQSEHTKVLVILMAFLSKSVL